MTVLVSFFSPKQLSLKLMRVVFAIYVSVTFVVTAGHFFVEYKSTQASIFKELQELEKTVHASFETSLWQLSKEQLDALAKGLVGMPIVEGIDVFGAQGETLVSIRRFEGTKNPFSFFHIENNLQRVLNGQIFSLGKIRLYSSSNVIFDRVLFGFGLIALTAIVKFSVLWALFSWAFRRFLGTPLDKLMSQIDHVHLEHIGRQRLDLGVSDHNELYQIQERFNEMLGKLERDRISMLQTEYDKQSWLESEVLNRTQDLRDANDKLLELAETDFLTGIRNRRSFFEQAETLFDLAVRQKQKLCFLLLDLDHFKLVNDTYGHEAGDVVLCKFANIVAQQLRKTDILGRVGGEEFAIYLPDTGLEGGQFFAGKILEMVANTVFEYGDKEIHLTVSIGLAVRNDDDHDVSQLFKKADVKLYKAKENGRNRVEV
jgi:diguanylate cyclase